MRGWLPIAAAFGLLVAWPCAAATPLDGYAGGTGEAVNSFTVTLSTTRPATLVLITRTQDDVDRGGAAVHHVSGVASGSLTMAKRVACSVVSSPAGGGARYLTEACYWWVRAPAALSSEVFTVSLDSVTPAAVGFMMAVAGAATPASPFDSNAILPSPNPVDSSTAQQVKTGPINTSATQTVLIGVCSDSVGPCSGIVNPGVQGWITTSFAQTGGTPPVGHATASAGLDIICTDAPVSGIVATWGPSFASYQSDSWGDAIVVSGGACGGSVPSPPRRPFAKGWPW